LKVWKRKVSGGLLGFVGYMLSPLSWWNDAFVNFPLALAFAWLVALPYKPAFEPALIVGYWLTNLAGLVLLHKGIQKMIAAGESPQLYSRRELIKDLIISLGYTVLMAALIKLKIFLPITDYLQGR
jgi:hypothetical protein